MKISEMRKELKKQIQEYREKGGNVYQTVEQLPYGILTYQIIFLDKKQGLKTTVKSLYNELGIEDYNIIGQPLNIERFKIQIQAHLNNGGSIDDAKNDNPYYYDINEYIKKQKAKGNNVMHEDVYRLCGYEKKNREITELDVSYLLNNLKDENGYIDHLKKTKEGKDIIEVAYRKAVLRGMEFHKYLNIVHGVRFKEEREKVDIIEYLGQELLKYQNKFGKTYMSVMEIYDKERTLFNKMKNMSRHFPLGQLNPSEILMCYGYGLEAHKYHVSEKDFLREVREEYPDGNIENILNDSRFFRGAIRVSAQNNQNVFQYFKSQGFTWPERTYNITIEKDEKIFNKLCEIRKEALIKSDILNSDDYLKSDKVEEFEKIATNLIKQAHDLEKVKKA